MLKIGFNAIQRAACAGIVQGSEYDCSNPLKASVSERLLIGNLDDISVVTYDVTTPSIITNITMKTGKQMFAFVGVRSSVIPDIGFEQSDIISSFIHKVNFSAFEVDALAKQNYQAMSAKKQFAIYQNPKDSSLGDAVWEVLGVNSGLDVTALSRLPQSKDGSYKIELTTPAQASETSLPNSFFDTDIPTTEALIEALLTPAT